MPNNNLAATSPQTTSRSNQHTSALDSLFNKIETVIQSSPYQLVHIEVLTQPQNTLRVMIDFKDTATADSLTTSSLRLIGIEDCIHVNHLLEEPLDTFTEVNTLFHSAPYDLEVSSPGIDRPLRKLSDYLKFQGSSIRVHTFRSLTQEEIENADYWNKNQKQKNFIGTLLSSTTDKISLEVKVKSKVTAIVTIPLTLITKANLEPNFNESLKAKPSKSKTNPTAQKEGAHS